jgi:hypothetical protein
MQEQGKVGKLVEEILDLTCVEAAGLGPKSRNDADRNIGVFRKDCKLAEPGLSRWGRAFGGSGPAGPGSAS